MYVIHSTYFFMFSKKRQIYLPYLFDDEQRTIYVKVGHIPAYRHRNQFQRSLDSDMY